ncbi:hypothetical protein J5I95_06670 [Candidatus Poribacteria bacterium]|nr:hypothetical protein [Candidatus Poribacteria bacterium]
MVIRFKKGKHQSKHKPDTLTCIRDDGSITWTPLHRGFVHHDFAHYVVETTLGFENAFFGLVSKGYDIPDFSKPKAKRPFEIPEEAMDTEPIVALLQADFPNTPYPQDAGSTGIFREYSAALPISITDEQLEIMRQELRALLQQWRNLQAGESMVLQFHT